MMSMKKVIKDYSPLFKTEVTLVIDDTMKPGPIKGLVARKLEKANDCLKRIKSLPKV